MGTGRDPGNRDLERPPGVLDRPYLLFMAGRWIVVFALFLETASPGTRAATTVLVPVRDNTIYAESVTSSNGAGEHVFAGRNNDNETRRGLLAFDLTGLPAGSTITAATLEMYCSKAGPGSSPQGIRLQRLLASWGEAGSDGGLEEGQGGPAQTGDARSASWRPTARCSPR